MALTPHTRTNETVLTYQQEQEQTLTDDRYDIQI